ncbi:MAG TPA: flagellar biosynthetic protein FliR [Candidatus Sumerlaeota bacterium]|nr:MAG: Flagellar biosynthetic protein FliR [candidate division BRC1 bacterium ADurb.BinA292]HOE96548.1 flagellar biosynthetic protein FliR [Candidatus Sumerlaeota bacterium]HOR27737.1 flagellar biosynthetic protein FliR [Candidatus Sumerlaeota bacterium]HPK03244.1 flagellar biosynthetic protein FliR [Candidatus Sumerlaeota bacterium]
MISIPLAPIYVGMLIFLRVGLVFLFFPLFGERFVPVRVRLLLGLATAIVLTPVAPVAVAAFPVTPWEFVQLVLMEALLAFGVGIIGRVLFGVVQFSGQIAGEQMGFGLVNAIDPTGAQQISVVAELQYVLAILVFLAAELHHVFIGAIARSFEVLPPGGAVLNAGVVDFVMRLGHVLFLLSVQFAMPVIIIIFCINVALGMVARAVPQINVFMESFPLRIIAGVSMMMIMLSVSVGLWLGMFGDMEGMIGELMGLMRG